MAEQSQGPHNDSDKDSGAHKLKGSLTQWLMLLSHKANLEDARQSGAYCQVCGLKVQADKPGSLTQWIFKFHLCRCESDRLEPSEDLAEMEVDKGDPYRMPAFIMEETEDSEADRRDFPADFPFERFQPMKEVARGVNGAVFLAVDRLLKKRVAVKLLNVANDQRYVDFQNEARAVSMIDHPNIVRVLDFSVSENGAPYMVMEYIEGQGLDRYLAGHENFEERELVELFLPVVEALGHAHSKGVLHRDLKPENILVVESAKGLQPKVVDFGLARIEKETLYRTDGGDRYVVGTPTYMSPDTVRGLPYDHRSDIYSLGTILFEAFSGALPFDAEDALELMGVKSSQAAPSLAFVSQTARSFSPELEALVARTLSLEPGQRYSSMEELHSALSNLAMEHESELDSQMIPGEILKNSGSPIEERASLSAKGELGGITKFGLLVLGAFVLMGSILASYRLFNEGEIFKSNLSANSKKTSLLEMEGADIPGLRASSSYLEVPFKDLHIFAYSEKPAEDAHLEALKDMEPLDGLVIKDCPISGKALKILEGKGVRLLFLRGCKLDREALDVIGELTTLEKVNLHGVDLGDSGLTFLSKLSKLDFLGLTSTSIEADDLKVLRQMPEIKELRISANKLGDDVFDYILGCNSLESLTMSDNNITERGILRLAAMKSLKSVYCRGSKLSPVSRKRVLKQMPNIKIYFEKSEKEKENFSSPLLENYI